MAYVIWRVVMKKYSKVRLGLHKGSGIPTVTPVGRPALTYDEESWKPKSEDHNEDITKSKENQSVPEIRQSKCKRVKNYLKKCKNVIGNKSTNNEQHSKVGIEISSTAEKQNENTSHYDKFSELDNVIEKLNYKSSLSIDSSDQVEVTDNFVTEDGKCMPLEEVYLSPPLNLTQEQVDNSLPYEKQKTDDATTEKIVKGEVAGLVDRYFGHLYHNYNYSRNCLIRQARDLLVCEYHGSLHRFEVEFCVPASKLLEHVKNKNSKSTYLSGWPLSLGLSGVIIHLGTLSPNVIRHKDCYLCIKNRNSVGLEIALIWRKNSDIHCHTLAELTNFDEIMCSTFSSSMDLENILCSDTQGLQLYDLLQNLLVSVEHVIERISLDDLSNPCPQCLDFVPTTGSTCSCRCSCRLSESTLVEKDTSIQTTPTFEFVGTIPHIDSDEDEDKDSLKSKTSQTTTCLTLRPKRILDIPEKLLMSGINLPGTVDVDGNPIILCYAECIARAGLNKYEISQILLYYSSILSAKERENGFTILLLAETDESKALDALDQAIALVLQQIRIKHIVIWKPNGAQQPRMLLSSHLKGFVVNDESSLKSYISQSQAPASCNGTCTHDQLEWVEFFKQLEPFIVDCQSAGKALISALSQLRNEEIPLQISRRFLIHQCKQISKVLQLDAIQKVRQEGNTILRSLEERTQWLSASRDVKRHLNFAHVSFTTVDRVAKRLEQLANERKERLKQLSRLKTLEDEALSLLAWICKVGNVTLQSMAIQHRTVGDFAGVNAIEKDFEVFYFDAMRQIDKASDVIDELNHFPEIKEKHFEDKNTNNLRSHVKAFMDGLEETRENIEDCCRCYLLLESYGDKFQEGSKEFEEFKKLSYKMGNEKLIGICKASNSQNKQEPPDLIQEDFSRHKSSSSEQPVTSTPVKPQFGQVRRRSVSSMAFIYKCNHHAAGVSCNCYETDVENSVSYKLRKKYVQSLQNCGCDDNISSPVDNMKDLLDRKNSLTLDGIKEVRESVENLLDNYNKGESRLSGCERCDSGVSTADNSVGDDSVYKKKLQRTCSCQFYGDSCALCSVGGSSAGSNQDHTEHQQDSITEEGSEGFGKSGSDDIEEEHFGEERRKVGPISANSHLHCYSSNLHLSAESFESSGDPKTQKTLLFIMREMVHTERDYVKSLDYIIENYIPELMREDIPQALRGQRNVIFGNVEKIYEFHGQHFLRELEQCENNPLQVGQIFLKHNKKFYLYALYNKNKPKSDSLMSEYGSKFFKAKQVQLGDKMDLASYLLKPVQRMGKYALLLQQLMKACPVLPLGAPERLFSEQDDLKHAEEMVRFQLRHGNDLLAMDSIRECDVNLKEQGRLMRQNEFIVWEGKSGKKSLRQVFLFEDLILFSKARRFPDRKNLDLFIYKNSIKLTDIGLTAKIGDSPTKFEIWFRKRKPNDTFIIQANSEEVKKTWAEELSQLLWKQAIRNREVRMAEMSSMGIGNKPCLDIRPSADQISDRSISFAQLTKTAPRFRNSIAGPIADLCRSVKRPHSIISMSSISSSSTSSGGSIGSGVIATSGTSQNLGLDSICGSPNPCRRSGTLNSQCSTESGIIADISLGVDECIDNLQTNIHWPLEKSNSQHSTGSGKSNITTPTQSDDTQVTLYHVPDDIPINI